MTRYAYCWRSGLIEIGNIIPDGAISVCELTRDRLRRIRARSRLAKDNRRMLVPGIPEAETDSEALEALRYFRASVVEDVKPLSCVLLDGGQGLSRRHRGTARIALMAK